MAERVETAGATSQTSRTSRRLKDERRSRWTVAWSAVAFGLVLLIIGAGAAGAQEEDPECDGDPSILVPCSGVLIGASGDFRDDDGNLMNKVDHFNQREAQLGQDFDVFHDFLQWRDLVSRDWPKVDQQQLADDGHILMINWKSPTGHPRDWAEIAAGQYDDDVATAAGQVADFGQPVFLLFFHEPEDNIRDQANGNAELLQQYIDDYSAAFRHLHDSFDAAGATNAVWVWDMQGYLPNFEDYYLNGLYPGDDVVDWIAYNPYNWYGCVNHGSPTKWKPFPEVISPFYDWLEADEPGRPSKDKPIMLGEFGSEENTGASNSDQTKAEWLDEARRVLPQDFPRMRALTYFDTEGRRADGTVQFCEWALDSSPEMLDAMAAMLSDPILDPVWEPDEPDPDPAGAVLGGSVVEAEGGPVAGVAVDLFETDDNGDRGRFLGKTRTDETGAYRFEVDSGCFTTTAIAPEGRVFLGASRYSQAQRCVEDGAADVGHQAVLASVDGGSQLGGTVTGLDGQPVPGVTADLFTASADGERLSFVGFTATGDDGGYRFPVGRGCYAVVLIAPDDQRFTDGRRYAQLSACVDAGPGATNLDAVLDTDPGQNRASLTGRITDGAGAGVGTVTADLFQTGADGSRADYLRSTTTDGNGSYEFELSAGCYTIVLISPDDRTFSSGSQFHQRSICANAGEDVVGLDGQLVGP